MAAVHDNDGASRAARVRTVHAEATPFDNCVHILRALHQELIPLPPLPGPAVASVPQTLEHEAKGIKRARFSTLFYRPHAPNAERRERRGCTSCCSITETPAGTAAAAVTAAPTASARVPLRVTVDEPCCGIGGTRSAVRYLNARKRARLTDDDDFVVVSALDADERQAKTRLYNATAWRGETLARSLRIESAAAHAVARRVQPLLTVCGLPCWDLSVLGLGDGVLNGPTAAAFDGFFRRLGTTRSPLLIIEEVDALLFSKHSASFRFITGKLQLLGYHWRVRVLNSAKLGAAQQRLRCYLVCARNAAVLAVFRWPTQTHKRRSSTFADAMLPVGVAPRTLFLNPATKVARALSRPSPAGLARPPKNKDYSRVVSVFDMRVHVLSSARACVATITASRSSGLYVWEGDALRRLAGVEALRFFTFSERETAEYAAAADALGISSIELTEMAGDSFVVVVVAQLMRALVDAFSAAASEEEKVLFKYDK